MRSLGRSWLIFIAFFVAGCPSKPAENAKYPPRQEGCDVQVFPEEPQTLQTENIGSVNASCGETVPDEECIRTLKDEACKMGADVVWGVEKPAMSGGKKRASGRAAHTRTGGGAAPPGASK